MILIQIPVVHCIEPVKSSYPFFFMFTNQIINIQKSICLRRCSPYEKVRFPFGFGLSYTTFTYRDLTVDPEGVKFKIQNTGTVAGTEIAQLYVGKESDSVFRPLRGWNWLREKKKK